MIDIEALGFGYGREALFRDVRLALRPGRIYGLLGQNGAGKSTLLKLMSGLLFPLSGAVRALGHEPAHRAPSFLADVFMLPEELHLPALSAERYVRGIAPFYPRFDYARFARYLDDFDLSPSKPLTSLSFGQKKKFLLSFGLASNCRMVLLDEPTNGLDIPSKGRFRRLVAEALTDERTFVISTHQVRDVESLIDQIVIVHDGRVLFNRSMSEITARIHMTHSSSKPASESAGLVYCEPALGGYWSVWARGLEDAHIDLEVLFNTVVSRPDTYAALFRAAEGGE